MAKVFHLVFPKLVDMIGQQSPGTVSTASTTGPPTWHRVPGRCWTCPRVKQKKPLQRRPIFEILPVFAKDKLGNAASICQQQAVELSCKQRRHQLRRLGFQVLTWLRGQGPRTLPVASTAPSMDLGMLCHLVVSTSIPLAHPPCYSGCAGWERV